jgi:hypothetical protein
MGDAVHGVLQGFWARGLSTGLRGKGEGSDVDLNELWAPREGVRMLRDSKDGASDCTTGRVDCDVFRWSLKEGGRTRADLMIS